MKTNGESLTQGFHLRKFRIFSKELKQKLVSEIEHNRLTIRDVVNLYKVADQTVYRWLKEYSSNNITGCKMVVESKSKETKIDNLMSHIAELERTVGKKQLELDFLSKVIQLCSEELGYDVKKKYTTTRSNGTR